ncbi:MAG: hypothetical protein CMA64_01630 [Euryarchaeota archaeon]|nr:hypothetical protein [Euryarchaeota archaeon]
MEGQEDPTRKSNLLQIQDEIRLAFGWSLERDVDIAKWLIDELMKQGYPNWSFDGFNSNWSNVKSELLNRRGRVCIVGAAVEKYEVEKAIEKDCSLVIADGSAGVFSELDEPAKGWNRTVAIVTDGDGGRGLDEAIERGIPLIIHAHGDNRMALESLISKIRNHPISLTHQTRHGILGMRNPGGFTDGDRAACIAIAMGVEVSRIDLLGTRSDIVGKYSGVTNPERKLKKLVWMKNILEVLGFEGIR